MIPEARGVHAMYKNYIHQNKAPIGAQIGVTPAVAYNEAEKIASGLMALADYTMASANISDSKNTFGQANKTDEVIINEAMRLKKSPKLIEYNELIAQNTQL